MFYSVFLTRRRRFFWIGDILGFDSILSTDDACLGAGAYFAYDFFDEGFCWETVFLIIFFFVLLGTVVLTTESESSAACSILDLFFDFGWGADLEFDAFGLVADLGFVTLGIFFNILLPVASYIASISWSPALLPLSRLLLKIWIAFCSNPGDKLHYY